MAIRWTTVTIDCADAPALAAFYARVLGWTVSARDGSDWCQLRDPGGGVGINIQAEASYESPTWPDVPAQQQKMIHLELLVDDLEDAVRRVLDSGGRQAPHQPADRDASGLRVMLDPAGHPFCLFVDGE